MDDKWLFFPTLAFLIVILAACGAADNSTSSPPVTNTAAPTLENSGQESREPAPSTHTLTSAPTPVIPTPTHVPSTLPASTSIPTTEPQVSEGKAARFCTDAGYPETACTGVAANTQWKPLIQEFNGVAVVLVPVGCFQMGNNDGRAEEQPAHEICFNEPFWIDLTEVTPSQFANFLNDQPAPVDSLDGWLAFNGRIDDDYNYQLVKDGPHWVTVHQAENRPLENVTWKGANDYCNWRTARLPTEAEWEYAARGPESYLYPWGNELNMNNFAISRGTLPEVGSFPQGASWVGALDMAGGLFEWTSSLYKPYPYRADDGREVSYEIDGTGKRVYRGCPWYHSDQEFDNISATARYELVPDFAYWYHGFRCARSIDYQE